MILVDSSVWMDHFNTLDPVLQQLLFDKKVVCHPLVIGEIAMGNLKRRRIILEELKGLPTCVVARESEVLRFIDTQGLFGLGIGYIDAHLLAATRMTPGTLIWTRDKRLKTAALGMSIASLLN